ncbi:ESPR domain-containing protein [Neisseria cinerea]|uniref:ESPR domain-containing protein n=1 Tax=Neisseria cinerea TaxID=483 RepID=UPI0009D742A7|nr:ESPR domain-containing protein [Neisseria cinerea]
MNHIYKVVFNRALGAWVAVSELTKSHKKRASATAVAVTLVAGLLSPFAQATKTDDGGDSSEPGVISGYNKPRNNENLIVPPGDDPQASHFNGLGFGLRVVDKDRHKKDPQPNYRDENDINRY